MVAVIDIAKCRHQGVDGLQFKKNLSDVMKPEFATYFEAGTEDNSRRTNKTQQQQHQKRSCARICLILLALALFVISAVLLVLVGEFWF